MNSIHPDSPMYGRRTKDLPDTRALRDKIVAWITARDTVLMEASLGMGGVVNAVLTVTTDQNGNPVAPFVVSTLEWLNFDITSWFWMLSLYAIVSLVSLVHGQATGNAYLLRATTHAVGSIFQAVIATAILTSPNASAAGLRYGLTAFWSFVIALILIVKYDVRRHMEQQGK